MQSLFYPKCLRSMVVLAACCLNGCPPVAAARVHSFKSDTSGYALVWADEFKGQSVDTASWNFETGGAGWGNREQEYYQADNATVSNGQLVIVARRERHDGNAYTSSRLTTKGKREFLYGKIEARIQIPVGQGLWPAFWLLGADIDSLGWPACGETDIMEHINTDSLLYGTLHWNNNGHVQSGDTIAYTPSLFHVYAVEWDKNDIRWTLDGRMYHHVAIQKNKQHTAAFHRPFFILLNLAVGGNWPGQVVDESRLPAAMRVDYVRVYQKR